jgi:hypothetical protein
MFCDDFEDTIFDYEPMNIDVNYESIPIIGQVLYCACCGNRIDTEEIIYDNMKSAKVAYEQLHG